MCSFYWQANAAVMINLLFKLKFFILTAETTALYLDHVQEAHRVIGLKLQGKIIFTPSRVKLISVTVKRVAGSDE